MWIAPSCPSAHNTNFVTLTLMGPSRWVFCLLGRLVVALMQAVLDLLNRLGDLLMWIFVRPPAGTPWRPVGGTERICLAWNRKQPLLVQYVVEGRVANGAELDVERLQRALDRVTDSQPGTRIRLRGARWWLHWIADGTKPRLRVVCGNDWDGINPESAPFVDEPLDPVHGPVAEVVVVKGDPLRFVFRALHAATDGVGCMLFVRGFFSALRDDRLTDVRAGPPIDAQVGKAFCPSKPAPKEAPAPVLIRPTVTLADEGAFARVCIAGDIDKAVARVGVALAESALVPVDKSQVRYAMSVDLRRLANVPPSSANLSGVMTVGLAGPFSSTDPVASLHRETIRTLAKREFGAIPVRAYRLVRFFSLKGLCRIAQRRVNARRTGGFATAWLSYIGGLKIAEFNGAGFCASSVYPIPPQVPFDRLFVGMVQTDTGLEIVAYQPGSAQMVQQLRDLLDRVAKRLNETP